jgi:hypothetical protein
MPEQRFAAWKATGSNMSAIAWPETNGNRDKIDGMTLESAEI